MNYLFLLYICNVKQTHKQHKNKAVMEKKFNMSKKGTNQRVGTITRGIFGGWYVIEHNDDMREKKFETQKKAVEYAELNHIRLIKPSLM